MTYIRFPFAEGGDRDEVPTEAQVDNSISFQEGYPVEYEQDPATNASARRLERRLFNGLMNRLSTELQQYQQFGFPEFIASGDNGGSAFPYSIGAFVRYNPGSGVRVYRSRVANNTALPTVASNWLDTGTYLTVIPVGSTSQQGIVQLNSSTNSTSASQAATPSAVNAVRQIAENAGSRFIFSRATSLQASTGTAQQRIGSITIPVVAGERFVFSSFARFLVEDPATGLEIGFLVESGSPALTNEDIQASLSVYDFGGTSGNPLLSQINAGSSFINTTSSLQRFSTTSSVDSGTLGYRCDGQFEASSNGTLVLNWEFDQITKSNQPSTFAWGYLNVFKV